jgi:hypothetical protein
MQAGKEVKKPQIGARFNRVQSSYKKGLVESDRRPMSSEPLDFVGRMVID